MVSGPHRFDLGQIGRNASREVGHLLRIAPVARPRLGHRTCRETCRIGGQATAEGDAVSGADHRSQLGDLRHRLHLTVTRRIVEWTAAQEPHGSAAQRGGLASHESTSASVPSVGVERTRDYHGVVRIDGSRGVGRAHIGMHISRSECVSDHPRQTSCGTPLRAVNDQNIHSFNCRRSAAQGEGAKVLNCPGKEHR